jgi:hypothetical protein
MNLNCFDIQICVKMKMELHGSGDTSKLVTVFAVDVRMLLSAASGDC